jgi:hypothetical protein
MLVVMVLCLFVLHGSALVLIVRLTIWVAAMVQEFDSHLKKIGLRMHSLIKHFNFYNL